MAWEDMMNYVWIGKLSRRVGMHVETAFGTQCQLISNWTAGGIHAILMLVHNEPAYDIRKRATIGSCARY